MTAQRMKEIQDSIVDLKEQRTKAEARMEQIEEDWLKTYQIIDASAANLYIGKLKTELEGYEERLEKLSAQIEDITDWDEVG